jgi:mono/diheme cytochrome c family protein
VRKILIGAVVLAVAGVAAFVFLTAPQRIDPADLAGLEGDAARGEPVFIAMGCTGCHAAPGAEGEARAVLSGGRRFETPFGTFVAPNISTHPQAGIGGWSTEDVVSAVARGTSPDGAHYFPAFPYASYARAELADLVDLTAYLRTLPADPTPSQDHEVGLPFNLRIGVGLWKSLYFDPNWVTEVDDDPILQRGRYLAEALGHCGECHTPRDALGGPRAARWLGGGPNPSGKGGIPNITPGKLTWSTGDLEAYFASGITPEFDSAGGSMAEVIRALRQLPAADHAALAAYLKAVPGVE